MADKSEQPKAVTVLDGLSNELTVTKNFLNDNVHAPVARLTATLEHLDSFLGQTDSLFGSVDKVLRFIDKMLQLGSRLSNALPPPMSTILSNICRVITDLNITG